MDADVDGAVDEGGGGLLRPLPGKSGDTLDGGGFGGRCAGVPHLAIESWLPEDDCFCDAWFRFCVEFPEPWPES